MRACADLGAGVYGDTARSSFRCLQLLIRLREPQTTFRHKLLSKNILRRNSQWVRRPLHWQTCCVPSVNLPTGHSPTLERVGYCRASQGDEELRPNALTMATFCLDNKCFEPLFSRRNILHGVAPRGDRELTFMLIAFIELI